MADDPFFRNWEDYSPQLDLRDLAELEIRPEHTFLGIQAVAVVASILQALSPWPVIRRITKLHTTGDFSFWP
eukprot:CAMPEP_0184302168 /NCGR_PEP_ID=MMETSP1049-20130417/12212_1 /TAXON_ID=77928 /ORGANISM="Proteomonas sulcata, Strain CCMP704" /LENGTH=71 /DNA_ID=CAMNT_0026613383 /DNA_START=27 /DNA_END=242 /DNA_ORIENTATION=+